MMVRDAVQWVALARVLPSKSRMVLPSDRVLIRMLACLTNYHLHKSQLGKMETWSREARGVFQAALDERKWNRKKLWCLLFWPDRTSGNEMPLGVLLSLAAWAHWLQLMEMGKVVVQENQQKTRDCWWSERERTTNLNLLSDHYVVTKTQIRQQTGNSWADFNFNSTNKQLQCKLEKWHGAWSADSLSPNVGSVVI